MVLNDPCDHRYVLYTHGGGPGSLWEASGLPPKLPGVIAGGVRLVSLSAMASVSLISVITTSESGNVETRGQREHFGHLPTVLMS